MHLKKIVSVAPLAFLVILLAACGPGYGFGTSTQFTALVETATGSNGKLTVEYHCPGSAYQPCKGQLLGHIDGQTLFTGARYYLAAGYTEPLDGSVCTALPCPPGGHLYISGGAYYGGETVCFVFNGYDESGTAGFDSMNLSFAPGTFDMRGSEGPSCTLISAGAIHTVSARSVLQSGGDPVGAFQAQSAVIAHDDVGSHYYVATCDVNCMNVKVLPGNYKQQLTGP
ncbi:MAG: hypothetical protein ACRDFS_02260 [Chloroflexota bacterium]